MVNDTRKDLGRIIKQRRLSIPMTLCELSAKSGVSQSHLNRIERGERFPSAHVLRRIAHHLYFDENQLFMLAGYLSGKSPTKIESHQNLYNYRGLDPYVARTLAREPLEVQRTIIRFLNVLRGLAKRNGGE